MTYTPQTWANGEAGGTPIDADALNHMEDGIAAAQVAATLDDDVAALVANGASDTGAAVLTVANARAAAAVAGVSIPTDADDLTDGSTRVMMLASERTSLASATATLAAATQSASNGALVKRDSSGFFLVNDPVSSSQPASKGYVDTAVAAVANELDTEAVQDIVGGMISAGSGISVVYDDALGTVEIDAIGGGGIDEITYADLPAGSVLWVEKSGGSWPARPTSRSDVLVIWKGADPDPSIVSSGTAGALAGDLRVPTA